MSFLRPRKVEKNYDLFSGCAWYTPGVAGVFAVLGWFLAGMILGSLITTQTKMKYANTIVMLFILPMWVNIII